MQQVARWRIGIGVGAQAFGVLFLPQCGREERLGWALAVARAAMLLAGAMIAHGPAAD